SARVLEHLPVSFAGFGGGQIATAGIAVHPLCRRHAMAGVSLVAVAFIVVVPRLLAAFEADRGGRGRNRSAGGPGRWLGRRHHVVYLPRRFRSRSDSLGT